METYTTCGTAFGTYPVQIPDTSQCIMIIFLSLIQVLLRKSAVILVLRQILNCLQFMVVLSNYSR